MLATRPHGKSIADEGERPHELPKGWVNASIGEVCAINPRLFTEPVEDDWTLSFVPMAAVEAGTGRIDLSQTRLYADVRKSYTMFSEGDILFAKITPCMENGKIAIARGLTNRVGCGSTEFHVLRPGNDISSDFLKSFLLQDEFRRAAQRRMAGTAGQLRVPVGFLEEAAFPLPPLPEQRRIVAEIEKQFTRLDASVASLKRVQANLKRYRASVLKAACEGRLVPIEAELARAEGRGYEHASVLLERILAERRARWESQPKRRGKYKEPVGPDTSGLPELPEGWTWATAAQLGEVRLGRQRSPRRATGPNMRPYLRAANVTWDGLDLSDVKEMDFDPREYEIYRLRRGDILLAEASGSADEVGKPAIWGDQIDGCCFQNTLIRIRAFPTVVPYLFYQLLSDARTGALGKAARGVGIHHLGAQRTESWTVAFPPPAEQDRIVAEVDRRLSVIQQAEATVEANLTRAERLRQSILKQAFSGKLVPQDPNDEPASVLLERIRAEREAADVSSSRKERRA